MPLDFDCLCAIGLHEIPSGIELSLIDRRSGEYLAAVMVVFVAGIEQGELASYLHLFLEASQMLAFNK